MFFRKRMFGAIVGDILGSVYEHQPIRTTDFPFWELGSSFTDDTVLTVAVAEALLDQKDYGAVFRRYYHRYPNAGYGGSFHRWARSSNPQPYGSWGNGSAMRVSPVGWFYNLLEDAISEAWRSAEITHNHPEGIRGAECVAACIVAARKGASKEDLRTLVEDRFYTLQWTLDQLRPGYSFDVSCTGTVPVALLSVLESTDYESAVRLAISMGGDSDTLACIAGSIAEAFYGEVPAHLWQQAVRYLAPDLLEVVDRFASKCLRVR